MTIALDRKNEHSRDHEGRASMRSGIPLGRPTTIPSLSVFGPPARTPLRRGEVIAVYGALRPSAGRLASLGFERALAPMGPCRIPGVLLDFGAYPGIVAGEGVVAGELVRLLDVAAGPRLDAFEDFDPKQPQTSLYTRRLVRLLNPPRSVWIYVWNRPPEGEKRVMSGDWLVHGRAMARVNQPAHSSERV